MRKTFNTLDEAEIAVTNCVIGEGALLVATSGITNVTWRTLFDNAAKRKWRHSKTASQQQNAVRVIEKYLGWDSDVRNFDQKKTDILCDQLEQT